MNLITDFLIGAVGAFIAMWFVLPILLFCLRLFGLYTIVQEGTCQVFVLFGRVVGILREPGLHILPFQIGLSELLCSGGQVAQRHLRRRKDGTGGIRDEPDDVPGGRNPGRGEHQHDAQTHDN